MTNMLKGKIILYDSKKGSGYVRLTDTREEFFFKLNVKPTNWLPSAGTWVTFELQQDRTGYAASGLQPLNLV